MAGGYTVPPLDAIDALVRRIRDIEDQVKELQRPTGTQLAGILADVQALIGNIGTYVDAYLATGFSTGSITASGSITAAGGVSGATVSGELYGSNITFNITATRVALWGRTSDGFVATATSSERFKQNIRPVDLEEKADAVAQIVVSYFEYTDEVRKRDDPSYEHYVGPSYHVATNMGAIAEQMHELGLWEWVVYEREIDVLADKRGNPILNDAGREIVVRERLKVDERGEPIPYGIHDILIGWAALILAQRECKRREHLERRTSRIEAALGLDPID